MSDLNPKNITISTTPITVLGGGRWGSAMAIYLAQKGFPVTLFCHEKESIQFIKTNNYSSFLEGFPFPKNLNTSNDINDAIDTAKIIVVSTPIPFLRVQLESITLKDQKIFVTINKGVERQSLKTAPEIVAEFFPDSEIAHLGGPCFPQGLLDPQTPVAETLASKNENVVSYLQTIFSSDTFRIYRSSDIKGVALLGAVKNIYAIAAGMCEGKKLHEEVLSVLLTRGLVEMNRLCQFYDISPNTLYGLSGLGDLALTCYSPASSHNKNFGKKLAEGKTIDEVIQELNGTIAEGYYTTDSIFQIAKKHKLNLPIVNSIYNVLYKNAEITAELTQLMQRPLQDEISP